MKADAEIQEVSACLLQSFRDFIPVTDLQRFSLDPRSWFSKAYKKGNARNTSGLRVHGFTCKLSRRIQVILLLLNDFHPKAAGRRSDYEAQAWLVFVQERA